MQFSGRYVIEERWEDLFQKLQDPAVLMRCIPGCEELVRNPDGRYEARLVGSIFSGGPFAGKLTGKVVLKDVVPPSGFSMEIEGRSRLGSLSGMSRIALRPIDSSRTEVSCESEFKLRGLVAGLGGPLVRRFTNDFLRQFFSALERESRGGKAP